MASFPDIETPDFDVIASQLTQITRRKKTTSQARNVSLASALTGVGVRDTMQGSSSLTISLEDQEFVLLESSFFDADENGRLDPIDINYPIGSKYWWRVTQVSPNASGKLDLTLMERAACYMMEHHGPLKVSRAKMTRAEFLQFLARHVKKGGGITFHSRELTDKQPLVKPTKDQKKRRAAKTNGVHLKDNVTIKGAAPNREQVDNVNIACDVADGLKAPKLAWVAMLCAGIGESEFKAVPNAGGSNYWGVFQGGKGTFKMNDTAGMAEAFLKGGHGFQGGGAIHLAKANPGMDPGGIATMVEASGQAGVFYGKWKKEAEALYRAYGGGSSGGTTRYKQYNFEVGSQDNPHEDYWAASTRLAAEVNWAFFLDGDDLFYDSELELIKQQPIAIIHRDDPAVVDWDYTWDVRHIATEMTLVLICEPFEFRAGEVFKLFDFGAASTGSTAKLPGRWLISESDRDKFAFSTTFTLRQPTKPLGEPRSELVTTAGSSGGEASTGGIYTKANLGRVDQGVDFTGRGPVPALADGKITRAQSSGSGWPGGTMIVLQLDKPVKVKGTTYKYIFVAENIDVKVITGQQVKAGDTLGIARGVYPFTETGFADDANGTTYARTHGGYTEGQQTRAGKDMLAWMGFGGKTPGS